MDLRSIFKNFPKNFLLNDIRKQIQITHSNEYELQKGQKNMIEKKNTFKNF